MGYKNPAEFDRAIKRAIRTVAGDPGEQYRRVLRDRFLCRIFSDPEERFVLKGASGMLARIPNARTTRDLDFMAQKAEDLDSIVQSIEALISKDMNDYCRFVRTKCEESLDENGDLRLVRLRYATFLGDEEKDPILIDLSLNCTATMPPDKIAPVSRIDIEDVETRDYLLYPLADQLADKMCAIMEKQPGGWPSSRMKDLADVVVYVEQETFVLGELAFAISFECKRRAMEMPDKFSAPREWEPRFASFAKKSKVPESRCSFESACDLAASFFNPALESDSTTSKARWNPKELVWR